MTTTRADAESTVFTFPVDAEQPNDYLLQYLERKVNSNGLYNTLLYGYSRHIPIAISPDHVLNSVATIWAKYVDLNAEKFRSQFVEHEGKKKILYRSGGTYSEARWPEFTKGLLELVKDDQPSDMLSWVDQSFSTSAINDYLCRNCCMLASQKAYYEYGMSLACGFSLVKMQGKENDWAALSGAIELLPTLGDSGLMKWQAELKYVIKSMLSGDESFWQSAITEQPYGSGGQSIKSGWATAFNPINENGDWISSIDDKDMLNMTVDFDVNVDDNGSIFDVTVLTGVDRLICAGGFLSPVTHFEVNEKAADADHS